ncbi:uncharacterized protein EI90DRAFT_3067026 [Cantharellus anzutake]|uniref:uncharacterized protein n=1 Tax=Cantharellus anzutake TaxID=1750568 RepID=UPI00190527C5|nr:uncharacterized protein EI90DRAFT_3067026 [Cantharellus anzutake]KAF8327793.1 hypothetical protein EI90DRAFT_3067026 [Cantharellus anzutake]
MPPQPGIFEFSDINPTEYPPPPPPLPVPPTSSHNPRRKPRTTGGGGSHPLAPAHDIDYRQPSHHPQSHRHHPNPIYDAAVPFSRRQVSPHRSEPRSTHAMPPQSSSLHSLHPSRAHQPSIDDPYTDVYVPSRGPREREVPSSMMDDDSPSMNPAGREYIDRQRNGSVNGVSSKSSRYTAQQQSNGVPLTRDYAQPMDVDRSGYGGSSSRYAVLSSRSSKIQDRNGGGVHKQRAGTAEPDPKRTSKIKREVADRVAKYSRDIFERRDDVYTSGLNSLANLSRRLHQSPSTSPFYAIRLYPIALERAALLDAISLESQYALDSIQNLWRAEVNQIEEEFRRSKTRLRERVMEGLEERRRRAREEKDGDGTVVVESSLEATASVLSRPVGSTTPKPPFVLSAPIPYGLSPDDLASPFPLSLNSTIFSSSHNSSGAGAGRKPRLNRTSGKEPQLTLGKAIAGIIGSKEGEIDHDLGEIRRAVKRRRAAAKAAGAPAA